MLKISCAGCLGLSLAVSSQLTFEVCATAKKIRKIRPKLFFRGLRSFKVIDVDKTKKPVSSAYQYKQLACAYLQPFFTLSGPITAK